MKKGDANDILRAVGADGLRDIIDRTPPETPTPPTGADYEAPPRDRRKAAPSRFVLTRFADFKPLDGDA